MAHENPNSYVFRSLSLSAFTQPATADSDADSDGHGGRCIFETGLSVKKCALIFPFPVSGFPLGGSIFTANPVTGNGKPF